jgi:STE24 endopeptidase
MNIIAIIILVTLIVDFSLGLFADWLNLKALSHSLPKEFEGLYDAKRYSESQNYLKTNTRLNWVATIVDLLVLIFFWFGGGFAFWDRTVRSLGLNPVINGLIFIGGLLLLKAIIGLPFSIYHTFGIEARFGFNQTDIKTFVIDRLKGLILGLLLGGPLLVLVLWFFETMGPSAWWICWGVVIAYMLIAQFVAPTWIMPLFNRFEPIAEGALKKAVEEYAKAINFDLKGIYVMDGSKRSTKSNAFFTGFGRHRRIVLFDTLIEKHTVAELVGVLAHEMGHFKLKHIPKMMIAGMIQMGVMFWILSFFLTYQGLFEAFYVAQPSVYAGLVFFGLLLSPLDLLLGLIFQAISRKHEYQADRFSVETSGQGAALIEALKKLSIHNLSNLRPHPFYVILHYSHPPLLERVNAIKASLDQPLSLNQHG